jgi:hypothetical protein
VSSAWLSRVCHHPSSILFSTRGPLACSLAPPTREDTIGVSKAATFHWDSPPRRSLCTMVLIATHVLHATRSRHSSLRLLGGAMRRPQSRVKAGTERQTCHMNYAMVVWTTSLVWWLPLVRDLWISVHFTLYRLSDEHPCRMSEMYFYSLEHGRKATTRAQQLRHINGQFTSLFFCASLTYRASLACSRAILNENRVGLQQEPGY